MPELSKRLKIIASYVPQGKSVCDVGTDHGYLPAALYLSGKYGRITATDIRKKPLQNAKNNLEKLKIDGVKLVLCNGLEGVAPEEAETVVIAGMGGDVIAEIIENCSFNKSPFFILQPMTAAVTLRKYLADKGFEMFKEVALCENKKLYSVITAKYCGKSYDLSPAKMRIGVMKPDTEDNISYIKKQIEICGRCVRNLENIEDKRDFYEENRLAVEELIKISEV